MLPKGAVCLPLLVLSILAVASAQINTGSASSRFYLRKDRPPGENRRSFDVAGATSALRREASFDPDVLNRFLEEYASKIKRTTERSPPYDGEGDEVKTQGQGLDMPQTGDMHERNATGQDGFRDETVTLNDTTKRHKFYNANSHEDRNSGWVTLEAIPWSKSKISKWQANPTTQGPWPDSKPWDKPSYNKPPWNSDFPRPSSSYESSSSSKPWQNKKPHWQDNSPASSNKPWYSQDRPRPGQQQSDRPSYPPAIDKYEENPSQAQKWPPERPSWDRYGDSSRPSSDIITDDAPPNFPSSSWDRPGQRPSYTHHTESYVSEPSGWHDRNDFPSHSNKFSNNNNRPSNDGYYDRPHFSQYQYPSSNEHPSNHPSSGDGQWVLLSTNRGYSKSRQRSIKLDALVSTNTANGAKSKKQATLGSTGEEEEHVPAVTSKRQVRLTVLPSINGTNTTTSHGGLLEVERTFKTVDQSQKEYEMEKSSSNKAPTNVSPLTSGVMINRRPIRNTITGSGGASSSAVLAAVGAGMLPATMAMMIPMMLGRRKRNVAEQRDEADVSFLRLPKEVFEKKQRRRI
ncbi:uncharacterized protein LOC100678266 [Nasonia vitripennis]|uniref:Uncharacterized protein n=1 Tax=Nasonia vitripennis TaxID=7425 RepID=A0A7M7HB08_NASVI|nr:uncharacterized protein LOC100678266 [Nasonia vitripennis]